MKLNWALFALVAWILFGMELGLRQALRLGPTTIAPTFIVPLLVFVALAAPTSVVWWASLALGIVYDLTNVIPTADSGRPAYVVGPYALGFLVAGHVVVAMRSMMIRRNPFTMAVLSIVATAVAQVIVVCMFSIRSAYGDPIAWEGFHELLMRLGSAVVTGASGFVLYFLLSPLAVLMGLQAEQRRFARRT